MTAPTVKVEIGFNATASLGSNFVLNDPIKGVLNNTTYTLGQAIFVDVTQWCSGQITINRGRSRQTDQYTAGTLNFTLRNEDRRFDPSNTASPYYPGIAPRSRVNAYVNGTVIFSGYVDDLQVEYQQPNICTVAVTCLDGFTVLANSYLQNYAPAQQLSGARISNVLDTVAFPATRRIAAGFATLQGNTFSGAVAALDHVQTVARSENGYLFCTRDGVLTFLDRRALSGVSDQATFADDGTGVSYIAITQASQALLLYNQVIGTRNSNGGATPATQTAQDAVSEQQYLVRSLSLGQLENLADSDVLDTCGYLLGRYSQPDVRFATLTVELVAQSQDVQTLLASLELTQVVMVKRDPPGTGTPTVLAIRSLIDGIAYAFDVGAGTYRMTLQLSNIDTRNFFILDDPVFGVLDDSKLGY